MKDFKEFLCESVNTNSSRNYHIYEYKHHTEGPHNGFGNPCAVDVNGVALLDEGLSPEEKTAKVRDKLKPALKAMHEVYGPADAKPAPNRVLKQRIESRFDELAAMSPKERSAEYKKANEMLRHTKVGHPIASNSKTDTAAEIPTKNGPNGQIPLGMSFAPDHAYHYTSPDATQYVHRNVCAGSTAACRSACLAKHGNYTFIGNQAAIASRTQRLTHNENGTRHHATLVYQALEAASKKAKKEGKSVLLRGSVTDDTGADLHHDAVSKHFSHVHQMGYTKKLGTKHDPSKKISTIFSDAGPMVYKENLSPENIQRRKVLQVATTDRGMPSYVVFNQKRPGATAKPGDAVTKRYRAFMDKFHTMRRYEPLPSEPKNGEKPEYHHKDGYGRVVHNGKSYRYQDHPVADKITDVHGKLLFPSEHDSRNADTASRTYKTPEGKKVGHIVPAFATASTSNKDLDSGFFHDTAKLDSNGVYHDSHPRDMHAAGFGGVKSASIVNKPTGKSSGLEY